LLKVLCPFQRRLGVVVVAAVFVKGRTTFRKYIPKKHGLLEKRFTNYVALSGYIYMICASP
jgi:hypothetical protein